MTKLLLALFKGLAKTLVDTAIGAPIAGPALIQAGTLHFQTAWMIIRRCLGRVKLRKWPKHGQVHKSFWSQ